MKRLHAGHGSFVKLKTALTAAKKWQPSFDGSLTQIIKRCKLCTHHSDIIDTEVNHFNDVVQVETIDGAESSEPTISDALNTFKTQKRSLIFIVSKKLRHKKGV